MGPKKHIVVERDSAILGYFNEISAPLNANHAHVSKYPSPDDPNYLTVKNVIKSMVERFRKKHSKQEKRPSSSMLSHTSLQSALETLLNMIEPQSEMETLMELYVEGTSDWLIDTPDFQRWLGTDEDGPSILHITGHAGAGKSVTAAFLARHLEDCGRLAQFFFFRFDSQQTGKSIRHCLLSLAYQLALVCPEYGRRLKAMLEDRRSLANADARRLWQKVFFGIFAKLEQPMEPIYWIIDALDESDSVQAFLSLLPSLKTGRYPVRIAFFTRQHTTGHSFERLKATLQDERFFSIEMSTPRSGLESYIQEELQFVSWPSDQEFMDHITSSLLDKCRGNFLWLRLVLKELTDCDYQHEALAALEETPPELAAVYHRIQLQLVKDMRPDSRELAVRVLSWIACSDRQLTLEELAEGLKTQGYTAQMLHPQQTISRLCGDLVTIDKNRTVSMVHHTAKEFITQNPDSLLYVNTVQAHSLILRRCLDELTDPKFRLRIKTEGCRGFLQYVVSAWSYHLALSNEEDDGMIAGVASFLQSRPVLCWIDAASQLGQLRILTTAAKNMTTFRERRRRFNLGIAPNLHREEELEVLEQWSIDLVRIVGKFGQRLLHHPSAVYTLVPPLCPPESGLSRCFLQSESIEIRVSGQKRQGWDDCLASFSVGHDCQPTAITVLEDHFAIHTSDERVTLYISSIIQELHQFDHGEVIVAIAFSQEGDKLVTCGFKTVKIWDVITGRLLDCFPNPTNTRAVAAALHSNSTVILCCNDGSIRSQELGSSSKWKVTHREIAADGSLGPRNGTPTALAFSPDATKLALVFRGRWLGLWSVETGRLIGRCQRHTKGAHPSAGGGLMAYPQRLTWNPIHEHIVGIYNDGSLFKWNPVDSVSEELDSPLRANEVACSPDGRFLVTATNGGSLHVWQYDSLRPIYHLTCASPVTALAVGSDARRLYDLRESFCNVWEPNSLIRLAESDEKSSDASSHKADSTQMSLTSEFQTAISDPVTALALAETSAACCFATDNGDLTLRKSSNDNDEVVVDGGFFGATHLTFSHDGARVACVDIQGSIVLRSTNIETPLIELVRFNPGGIVQQLLFSNDDLLLIVKTPGELSLWDTQTAERISTRSLSSEDYWLELHPTKVDVVIAFSPTAMSNFSLKDLEIVGSWNMDLETGRSNTMKVAPIASRRPFSKYHMGHSDAKTLVARGLSTPDRQSIFLQLVREEPQSTCSDIEFFLIDLTTPSAADEPVSVNLLPPSVLACIEIPLGFVEDTALKNQRYSLAFLDVHFWVCSWSLDDTRGDRIRRHFFLPNDWINLDCLDMAVVTPDGRFVCPRNGEVAVVSGGFNTVWIE